MSVYVMSLVFRAKYLLGKAQDALFVLALADIADDEGNVRYETPTIGELAEKARCSLRKAQYIQRDLEARGLLEVRTATGGSGARNSYRIVVGVLEAALSAVKEPVEKPVEKPVDNLWKTPPAPPRKGAPCAPHGCTGVQERVHGVHPLYKETKGHTLPGRVARDPALPDQRWSGSEEIWREACELADLIEEVGESPCTGTGEAKRALAIAFRFEDTPELGDIVRWLSNAEPEGPIWAALRRYPDACLPDVRRKGHQPDRIEQAARMMGLSARRSEGGAAARRAARRDRGWGVAGA